MIDRLQKEQWQTQEPAPGGVQLAGRGVGQQKAGSLQGAWHIHWSITGQAIPGLKKEQLSGRCRKSSTTSSSAGLATAEQVMQKGAYAAHERAPAPAEVWLLVRQACQQQPNPTAA